MGEPLLKLGFWPVKLFDAGGALSAPYILWGVFAFESCVGAVLSVWQAPLCCRSRWSVEYTLLQTLPLPPALLCRVHSGGWGCFMSDRSGIASGMLKFSCFRAAKESVWEAVLAHGVWTVLSIGRCFRLSPCTIAGYTVKPSTWEACLPHPGNLVMCSDGGCHVCVGGGVQLNMSDPHPIVSGISRSTVQWGWTEGEGGDK